MAAEKHEKSSARLRWRWKGLPGVPALSPLLISLNFMSLLAFIALFTLLEGSGVSLVFPAFSHRLRRGETLFFAVETPLSATPIVKHDGDAANRDFNIMTRRDSHYATVMAVRDAMQLGAQEAGVFYVMDGCWRIGEETCQAGQGVWWASPQPLRDLTPLTEDAWLALHRGISPREQALTAISRGS